MRGNQRKSTPQVVRGVVRKKNNWQPAENRYDAPRPREIVVDRERPGEGYRHLLTKKNVYDFIALLPEWDRLAVGLNAIVLAPGSRSYFGYHVPGVVHVCAWHSSVWRVYSPWLFERDEQILNRFGVECEPLSKYIERQNAQGVSTDEVREAFGWNREEGTVCKFTEGQARAFLLLDVLLHELGHHHDRMTTRSQRRASRGEPYAETYALQHEALIWEQYVRVFPLF